ncbi:hypothetical protein A8990_13932 [Paenibacillus taihuensis]|uniref:H+/gluconate symporter-like permease n=1 Tax=Paenibacillus taihuensis TaxID=1156355 RepID=A0A3D9R1M0_9BACL|nr:hypothetical protein [Paenibacillus taihuensis]REE68043.1 hypothetical protein A8990_13932 [Paenibacillus taihuensis]
MLKIDRLLIFAVAAAFIALQLSGADWLVWALGGLVFIAMAVLLPQLRGMTLWLTSAFLAGGVVLLIVQQASARVWFESAGINATLVTLFVFAPLFGIPVRIPAYVEALRRFYDTSLRSSTVMFLGTQLLTQIMGAFINVGSIPVVYHLAFVKPRPKMEGLLAGALNRGFAGAICWSPYFAAMAIVTTALHLNWSSLLPYLVVLSLLTLIVSFLMDFSKLKRVGGEESEVLVESGQAEISEVSEVAALPEASKKAAFPVGLAVYLICAIGVILLLEPLIDVPMVIITCMSAVIFPVIWCFFKGAMATYRQGLINHLTVTLPALKKEITLFLAAGFFSGAVGAVGFGAFVPKMLSVIPLPIDVAFSLLALVLIAGTSIIGLHPIVLVSVFANGVDPHSVGATPTYMAVLLLGSWAVSNTVSPASAVNNLLSGLFKRTVFELARPNYKFAAFMGAAVIVYLMLLLEF